MKDATTESALSRLKKITNSNTDIELAKKLGLSKQSIAAARARREIPAAWLPKAAIQFGVSLDWLFFGHGSMYLNKEIERAHTPAETVQPTETITQNTCPDCTELKKELAEERAERRELTRENRQLWKENAALREELAVLKISSAKNVDIEERRIA